MPIRRVLAFPLYALQLVVAVLLHILGIVLSTLVKIQRGGVPHVYLPIVYARRMVAGENRWQVQDCLKLGLQPKTDEERSRADADERLLKLECVCGKPDCATNGFYISRDLP